MEEHYVEKKEGLYVRFDRRRRTGNGRIDDDLCEQLRIGGPLALKMDRLMIENNVWAVDFKKNLLLYVDDTVTLVVCLHCRKKEGKNCLWPSEIHPDLIEACLNDHVKCH